MSVRSAPHLALACLALRDGALAVLAAHGDASRRATLPVAPLTLRVPVPQAVDALVRQVAGRAAAWQAQVGAHVQDGLWVAAVAVLPADVEGAAGYSWLSPARLSGVHGSIARAAVDAVRARLDHEPVAFRLLGPTFTLGDLQLVYELLLERRVHKASFRRSLLAAHLVEPTDHWRSEGRGRPAQLFRYSPRKRRGVQRAVRFDFLG